MTRCSARRLLTSLLDFVSLHSGDIRCCAYIWNFVPSKKMDFTVISEYSGQSGGATPVPIPNTEVKPAYVLHCTKMCELSGTAESCYTYLFHLIFLLLSFKKNVFCQLKNQITIKYCHKKPDSYGNHKRQFWRNPDFIFYQAFF